MKIAAVIPARYSSTRFPGKPLAVIAGKTMVRRVFEQARKADCFTEIVVATDDERIAAEVNRFGGLAVMTPSTIGSGSDRVWLAMADRDWDAVVNIQGDEPLISEKLVAELARALTGGIATIVTAACVNAEYEDFLSAHVVKVVVNRDFEAIYFSRAPLPHQSREDFRSFYQHIGIYGYTRGELDLFVHCEKSPLEMAERLEQLRFIENGRRIRVLATDYRGQGVDVPGDIARCEEALRRQGG